MKKTIKTFLCVILAPMLLAGCSAGGSSTDGDALTGVVNTDGSTSTADMMAVLQEVFKELHPKVTVNFSGTGSGSGIEAVLAGTCDIGLSSRPLKDSEVEKGAVAHVAALDGVAVVVNPSNPVTDLSLEQIAQIFTGQITNWKQVGGEDRAIAVLGREAGSGTRGAFEEIVGIENACLYKNEYGSSGDIVGNVASNPNAIGYTSLSAADETVSTVKVDGVACSEATVKDGTYAIQRPFLMVTGKDRPLSDQAQAFLNFALSGDAAEYIAIAGAVAP